MDRSTPSSQPLLLYDGTCGFCARSVQFVLRSERRSKNMLFATLDGRYGADVRKRFPEVAGVDSIILFLPGNGKDPDRALVRSDAGLWVARYLGGAWSAFGVLGRIIPRPIRDGVYRLIAAHRHRIAGADACVIPTDEERARFLD